MSRVLPAGNCRPTRARRPLPQSPLARREYHWAASDATRGAGIFGVQGYRPYHSAVSFATEFSVREPPPATGKGATLIFASHDMRPLLSLLVLSPLLQPV